VGFGTAVCANYWFETLGLIGLLAITGFDFGSESVFLYVRLKLKMRQALVYFSVAVFFMHRWSGQKYRRYRKEFDPKVFPGKRYKMFPPIY